MPKVTYISFDGQQQEVDVPIGENIMRGALYNGVSGIEGECGGACACATCHCYVDEAWAELAGSTGSEAEAELLEVAAAEVRPTSRLSCQIMMTEALDGLVVHTPEKQYN